MNEYFYSINHIFTKTFKIYIVFLDKDQIITN
jgi:hypothetical protein